MTRIPLCELEKMLAVRMAWREPTAREVNRELAGAPVTDVEYDAGERRLP